MSKPTAYKSEILWFSVFLLTAIFLFWWRVWIPVGSDTMHFTDDVLVKDYPTRLGLFRSLLDGALPLWDRFQFAGWPGLANCEAGFFYPFNWLLIPFVHSPQTAYSVTELTILLHFFIVGLGTYLYARYLGLSVLSSTLAAVIYTFCGFHCAHKKHTNMLYTLVWFPWLLLYAERWLVEKRATPLVIFSLLLALAYLGGHPQAALYLTLILLARFALGCFFQSRETGVFQLRTLARQLATVLAVFALSASLTAIQWIPAWELIKQGERSSANEFQSSSEFSMPPFELADIVLPETIYPEHQVEVFYWGIAPLFLTLFALTCGNLKPLDWFFVILGGLSCLFALGEYIFVYDLSYVLIPGVAWVRAPSRWIYFASLPIALLAGRALHEIMSGQPFASAQNRTLYRLFLTFSGVGIFFFVAVYLYNNPDLDRQSLLTSVTFFLLCSGGYMLLWVLAVYHKISLRLFAILVILLCWLDLGTRYRVFDLKPGKGGYTIDTEVKRLWEIPWSQRTKVYFEGGGNRTLYHGAAQNFDELDGQSPLTPLINLQIRRETALDTYKYPNANLLDLLGVRTILTDMIDRVPPSFRRETSRLFVHPEPTVRAREFSETFYVNPYHQAPLLAIQSLPIHDIAFVDLPTENDTPASPSPLFPKPFLLASGSGNALQPMTQLIVDGTNHFAPLQNTPGYHIAVVNTNAGTVESVAAFDLNSDYDSASGFVKTPALENLRMQQFIAQIPPGKSVFLAVNDNAANMLLDETLLSLRSLGASLDVRKQFRLAHTIIGAKGASVGSAFEIISASEVFYLQTANHQFLHGTVPQKSATIVALTEDTLPWYTTLTTLGEHRYADIPIANATAQTLATPLLAYSAPKKMNVITQDFASIRVGGVEHAANQRGYNMVIVNPQTGAVVRSDVFDIASDWDSTSGAVKQPAPENVRMQDFIRQTPKNFWILGAIRDEATDILQPETVAVLQQLGSELTISADPDERKRLAHVFLACQSQNIFIEKFAKEKDAILFTHIAGEPTLLSSGVIPGRAFESPITEITPAPTPARQKPETQVFTVQDHGPNALSITGQFSENGLLFVNELFYPGWNAYMDGIAVPILRVNHFFRGVCVEEGFHSIEFKYEPASFWRGVQTSLFALLVLFAWFTGIRWLKPN